MSAARMATIAAQRPRERDWVALGFKGLVLYFVVSMAALPFLNAIWVAEIPVLAIFQLPKLQLAGWLRTDLVMPAIKAVGLSRGSFSPDFVLARPYALAIAYGIPVLGLVAVAMVRSKLTRSSRFWVIVLLALAVVDYTLTLKFTVQPALTLY